ncbi:hypothetical protein, partial [Vibrio cyclitrophicus]
CFPLPLLSFQTSDSLPRLLLTNIYKAYRMNESNYPTLMHVENINSLESLLFDKDAEGLHLFCSFNREELNPEIINKLQHSQFNSISFNNAKAIYPDGPRDT